ncbi:MAG: hypothetical protein II613_02640 [Bacteroidales bacterium]|nr:hypothetical protein [Bacteroidales bacterium]
MEPFFIFFMAFIAFIVISIVKSEKERRRRADARRARVRPQPETFDAGNFKVPEPTTVPQDNTAYYGEDVPRTTATDLHEDDKTVRKELDLDPEKMIIYSEILKPKF